MATVVQNLEMNVCESSEEWRRVVERMQVDLSCWSSGSSNIFTNAILSDFIFCTSCVGGTGFDWSEFGE